MALVVLNVRCWRFPMPVEQQGGKLASRMRHSDIENAHTLCEKYGKTYTQNAHPFFLHFCRLVPFHWESRCRQQQKQQPMGFVLQNPHPSAKSVSIVISSSAARASSVSVDDATGNVLFWPNVFMSCSSRLYYVKLTPKSDLHKQLQSYTTH